MDTDAHRSDGPEATLTYEIIGCAMEVLNGLGHGLHEKPYESALIVEQMLNYLRITNHRVGLILNFRRSKLEWERVVL